MGAITALTPDNPVTVSAIGFAYPAGPVVYTTSANYSLAFGQGTGSVQVDVVNGGSGYVFVYTISVTTGKAITQVNISDWNFNTVSVDSTKTATATLTEGSISFTYNTPVGGTAITAGHSAKIVAYSDQLDYLPNLVSVQGSVGNDTVISVAPVPEASTALFGAGALLMMLRFGVKSFGKR